MDVHARGAIAGTTALTDATAHDVDTARVVIVVEVEVEVEVDAAIITLLLMRSLREG